MILYVYKRRILSPRIEKVLSMQFQKLFIRNSFWCLVFSFISNLYQTNE